MKNILLSILLFVATSPVFAQSNIKANLTALLKHAETDFVNITGDIDKTISIKGYQFYDSKMKLGIGNESIVKKENEKGATYNIDVEYKNAKELETSAEELIKTYFDASKYDVKESEGADFETYTIEVLPKGTALPVLEMYTDFYDDLSFHLVINIYGYSKNFATIPTQNNYRSKIAALLLSAESDFTAILGKKVSETSTGIQIYDPTVKIGLGKETIQKNASGKPATYELEEMYDKAGVLDKVLIDYIKKNYPEPEFLLKSDGDENGNSVIEVYAKNNAYPFLELSLEVDTKTQTKYYYITIQSKSARM